MTKPTRHMTLTAGLLLATALPGGALWAAAGPREPSAPPKEALPSLSEALEVRVVNLEAEVTQDGVPVYGLGPADFRLRVNGEERPIDYFSEVRGGAALADRPAAAAGTRDIPTVVPGRPVGSSYLVFIDDYFSLAQDRDRVLDALSEQLGNLRPEDRMAIVAYDGSRLEMLSSWTRSIPALERAIREAKEWPAQGLQRWSERRSYEVDATLPASLRFRRSRLLPAGLRSELTPDEYFYGRLLEDQIDRVVMAASATLRGFGAAPGRRVAIVLSGGWPWDVPAYVTNQIAPPFVDPGFARPAELYAPLIDTANLLGYTLFPVDVPGLQATAVGAAELANGEASLSPRSTTPEREAQLRNSLEELARATGGRAIVNSARTDALRLAAGDTASYYWLGFTPDRQGDDARWKVSLEATRPGLKVRTRRSFTDLSQDREIGLAVESALLFGNPPSPQALTAKLSDARKVGARRMRANLSVHVPSGAIKLLPEDGRYVADLELRVAALDDNGATSDTQAIPLLLSADSPSDDRPLSYTTEVVLRPRTDKLVVALYDKASGSILLTSLDVAL